MDSTANSVASTPAAPDATPDAVPGATPITQAFANDPTLNSETFYRIPASMMGAVSAPAEGAEADVAPCALVGDEPVNAPVSLSDFKRVEMALTGDLKCLRDYAAEFKLDATVKLADDTLKDMADRSFSIAVVGEFKRGKSTLINALLGRDILPSDILPCSATLNRVTYGVSPRVKVYYKDGKQDEVPIDQLTNYVTKLTEDSEELASKVSEAVVEYPIPFCQNNVDIIDTPGLNDDENMTNVTLGVLPSVDAAILVILAQSPFSEYERDFVENKLLSNDLGRVLFLVTQIDRLNNPDTEADRLIESIRARIKRYVLQRAEEQFGKDSPEYASYLRKIGEPRVYGVSPYQALQAKATGNAELMKKSRFEEFEKGLEKFLSEDRGTVLLQVPVNRVVSTANAVLNGLAMREGQAKMSTGEFEEAFDKSQAELERLRQQKEEALAKVSSASNAVEQQIAPLCDAFDVVMKEAATQVIAQAKITPDDAGDKRKKATSERIGKDVSAAIQVAAQKHAEKIQNIVDAQIQSEKARLQEFGEALDESLGNINTQFMGVSTANGPEVTKTGTYIADALAVVTMGMGGGLSGGYREGGVKGALIGGAVGGATWLGGVMIASAIIPGAQALPVLIGLGFAGAAAARWTTRQVFGAQTVDKFRAELTKTTCDQIDRHVAETGIETQTFNLVKATFSTLSSKADDEIEVALKSTEKTIDEMRLKRERNETLDETQTKRFAGIRQKTQNILAQANNLNDQLTQHIAGANADMSATTTASA